MAEKNTDRNLNRRRNTDKQKPAGNNYLLVIGIDEYQHITPLNNAVRDAETIRDLLLDRYQFKPEHTTSLINKDASRENILESLHELEGTLTENDNFLLYFAGHGVMNDTQTRGFWIPAEARRRYSHYVSNSDVRDHRWVHVV